jgi:sulfoxide reductase heme-binding subunit YedZ
MTVAQTIGHWKKGVRLYVAIAIVLISLETWWWSAINYSGSILFSTRLEEAFAWYSLSFLIAALLIGPVYKTLPELGGAKLAFDARRMLGIGAAWFATLHASIAYIGLFRAANPLTLPSSYQRAFIIGLVALVILLTMAFTSFDKAFNKMGKWWFRLHRLVYVAGIAALLHAFLIGVHATETVVIIMLSIITFGILILHARNQQLNLSPVRRWQTIGIGLLTVLLLATFLYGYQHPPVTAAQQTGVAQNE